MKTINRNNSVLAIALFLLLWAVQPASAFYSPNLQRWVNRDPIQEAGGLNLFAYVANRAPIRIDPLGLTIASDSDVSTGDGGCPGTPPGKGDAKCYQYACDNYGDNSDTPGAAGGKRCQSPFTCDSVKEAALQDFEKAGVSRDKAIPPDDDQGPPGNGKGPCPEGTHKVAFAVGQHGGGSDFHWLRQTGENSWCHKFKMGKPSNKDGSGIPITDPSKANLNFPGSLQQPPSSYTFCGYLCAPNKWK